MLSLTGFFFVGGHFPCFPSPPGSSLLDHPPPPPPPTPDPVTMRLSGGTRHPGDTDQVGGVWVVWGPTGGGGITVTTTGRETGYSDNDQQVIRGPWFY